MRQIEVITRLYEWEHGRRPGGVGSWAFYFSEIPKFHKGKYAWFAAGVVSYTEAEKKAIAEARRRGKWSVYVAPESNSLQMDPLQNDELEYVIPQPSLSGLGHHPLTVRAILNHLDRKTAGNLSETERFFLAGLSAARDQGASR